MADRVGGFRRKTRHKMSKSVRTRGKLSQRDYFQSFEAGDKVQLRAESSHHKGMYHPRFYGKVGIVGEKRGRCYVVNIKDFSKSKSLIVHPIHITRL